jgi:tetratricopeptide (TPR) repeat protein
LFAYALTCYANTALANDNQYAEAMAKNIQTVYSSQSITELQAAVNTFERIASAEKTKWEPYYYAAFGNIMIAYREHESTKKDAHLDQAIANISKAKKITERESEIFALEGFVHLIRITVDPATRGQQYSGLAMQTLGRALSLNPENPRALALIAQTQYGTAKFLGSSTTEACTTNTAALEKFATFKSENPLAPKWGKAMAEETENNCR